MKIVTQKLAQEGFFRVRVFNTGRSTVKNLKAKVEAYDLNKKPINLFEPSPLRWINSEISIDLSPHEEDYINICSQTFDQQIAHRFRIELFDMKTERGIAWNRDIETYTLKVSFHAENLTKPVTRFFIFKPNTDANEPEIGTFEEKNDLT